VAGVVDIILAPLLCDLHPCSHLILLQGRGLKYLCLISLVEDMPRRLQMVTEKDEGSTKY
jgi:hypothetical protein